MTLIVTFHETTLQKLTIEINTSLESYSKSKVRVKSIDIKPVTFYELERPVTEFIGIVTLEV